MEKVVASQTMYHIGTSDVDLLRFMSQYHPSIFMLVHHFFHHHPVHVGAVLLVGVPGHLVPGQENWAPYLMVGNLTHLQKHTDES